MNGKAQICDQCGAPMKTRRECEYCGTVYYVGPDVPEPDVFGVQRYMASGSSMVMLWSTMASNHTVLSNIGNGYGRASY